MTDHHPITLPRELVQQWIREADGGHDPRWQEYEQDIANRAAQWQLECDAEWWKIILNRLEMMHPHVVDSLIEEFKQAMRPATTQENNQ